MERWKVNLYTLWVTQVFSLMGFGFCIPFIPFYFQDMGVTDPASLNYYVGLAFAIPAATMAVAAPVWGVVSDRYGRKLMLMRAMVAAAVLLVLMGMVESVWQFMVLRAFQGIFTGTVTASMSFVSANTPENRLSYALGLMTSSNFIGYSIGPFLGGLLAEVVGYRACFYLGGALMTVGFFLVVALVKEDPNTYGFRIRGGEPGEEPRKRLFAPLILWILGALFLQRIARSVFMPFVALHVQEQLGTVAGAAAWTGIINGATGLATAVAALTITRLGDQKDKMRLSLLLTLLSLPVALLLVPRVPLVLFTVLFTAFFFLAGAAEPILTSAASERTPASMRGALFGVLGTVGSIGAMVSPLLGSAVSVTFSLQAILAVVPFITAIQLAFLFRAGRGGRQAVDIAGRGSGAAGAGMGPGTAGHGNGAASGHGDGAPDDGPGEDLHLHTYYSDGTLSPAELVARAAARGVGRIAVTDHDGLDGLEEALEEGRLLGIEVVPGIEFSADLEEVSGVRGSVHILGHGIDVENRALADAVLEIRSQRQARNEALLAALEELGYPLEDGDLRQRPEQTYVGKPNFARAMAKRGYVGSPKEAFSPDRFLQHPNVRTIRREKIFAADAIRLIREAGGMPVLAHPRKIRALEPDVPGFTERLASLLRYLQALGLQGLECRYSSHTEAQAKELESLAATLGLVATAGSDFHGPDFDAAIDIGVTAAVE